MKYFCAPLHLSKDFFYDCILFGLKDKRKLFGVSGNLVDFIKRWDEKLKND